MRKVIFIFVSLLFTGGLLVYTGLANLDLLTRVSPNPRFVGFGMLCLEGGVMYWTAAYLLHWCNTHKGIALVMIAIDALFSLTGFFIELSNTNASSTFINQLPPVVIILSIDVAFNVAVGMIVHLLPDNHTLNKADFQPVLDSITKVKDATSEMIAAASKNGKSPR
jgi:hypothetical protein